MTRRITAAALTAAALALALTGCQSTAGGSSSSTGGSSGGSSSGGTSGGSGGADAPTSAPGGHVGLRDYTCELKFEPLPSGINVGGSIKATVFVKCPTHKPVEHHITVILERDQNGHWLPKQERTWDGIPGDPMDIRIVTTSCVPGSWRVRTETWGVAESGKAFASSTSPIEDVSQPREVKPSDCD